MKVLILGGGGMLGQKLARALAKGGQMRGAPITGLVLADLTPPAMPQAGFPVSSIICDVGDPASVAACITPDVGVIYLLSAVVSSHAEADLDAGLRVNLMGGFNVLERVRGLGTCPVLVFASSCAVYGGALPDLVVDATRATPQTSYGTQKAMVEMLVSDYSRRGLIDGRAFRLPTISVRPGAPNRAASGFMSSIFREPLQGLPAICPVSPEFAHYYLSPRLCVENLIRGAELPADALGHDRAMILPGRRWTIAEMIAAMTDVAGPEPARLIRWEPQPEVAAIVSGWAANLSADRALALGLVADASFHENIRHFLTDDLPR